MASAEPSEGQSQSLSRRRGQSQSWPEVLRDTGAWCWPGVREAPGRVYPFPCNSNVGKPSITASPFGSWRRLPKASNPRACSWRRRWSSRSQRGLERGVGELLASMAPPRLLGLRQPPPLWEPYKHKQARTRPRGTSGLWNLQVLLAELGPSCFSKRKVGDSWAVRPGGSLPAAALFLLWEHLLFLSPHHPGRRASTQ